jgi:RNA polymerase sigma factor (sigma-70 family)
MLTLEQVSPTCKYWANKFSGRNFDFDELFNVAYMIAIKQKSVLLLQKSVRGALLRFVMNRQKFTATCMPFQDDNTKEGDENPLALCDKEDCLRSMIDREELLKIIEEAKISQSDEFLEILRLRFVEDLSQKEIAEKFNVSQQLISNRYNTILESLITVNRRRISCQKSY